MQDFREVFSVWYKYFSLIKDVNTLLFGGGKGRLVALVVVMEGVWMKNLILMKHHD